VTPPDRGLLDACPHAQSADGLASAGPIVCACFGVGRSTICDAVVAGARSAAEIGVKLKARQQLRLVHSRIEAADRAG
jgi:NAD(P)H-nitrite reductase large subunit